MDIFSGSGSHKFISSRLGNEMSGQPIQDITEVMEADQQSVEQIPEPEVTELPVDKRSITELSSNTDSESCEAYFTRKIESLTALESATTSPNNFIPGEDKASESDLVAISPGLNESIPESHASEDVPKVVFLDKPDTQTELPEIRVLAKIAWKLLE